MEQTRNELKEKFKKGDKPTEVDYANLMDSYVNKTDDPYFKFNELPTATTTEKGIVEQATTAEVEAGSDKLRYVTPDGARRAVIKFTPKAPVISVNGEIGAITIESFKEGDSNWKSISLGEGIKNIESGLNTPRYRRKTGVIYLDGEINISSGSTGNTNLFKLDVGPDRISSFYLIGSNDKMIKIQIETNGTVNCITNPVSDIDISLSGVSFIAK